MSTILDKENSRHARVVAALVGLTLLLAILAMAGCQTAAPVDTGSEVDVDGENASDGTIAELPAGLIEIAPLDPEQAAAPARLQIPEIGMDVAVESMGWSVVTINGERTTMWDVPEEAAGWHVNSAGAGAVGNTAISGSQNSGEAVFAPLALGTVKAGQEVHLIDADGIVFVYRMREVSDPIPVQDPSDEEKDIALSYLSAGDEAQLTLITGWPDFTTTHRVFAAADFLGTLN